MASRKRNWTKYPGVYFVNTRKGRSFFITYRLPGSRKQVEERAGLEGEARKANGVPKQLLEDRKGRARLVDAEWAHKLRDLRILRKVAPNTERRKQERLEQERQREAKKRITWTLGKLWEEYAAVRSSDPAKPYKSLSRDEDRFNLHLRPTFGGKEPSEIDHLTFERWKRKVQQGRSPTTVWHCAEMLRRLVRFGTDRNLCAPLPFRLKLTKPDNQVTEYLEPDELAKLLKALDAEPPITGNLFRLALLCGLRRSELLRLEWSDVDLECEELLLRNTKAGKDQRLPISENAAALLHSQPRMEGCPFVFPSPTGKRWPLATLDRVFKRLRKRADLPEGFRVLHGLRHQYGSMLAEAGANLVELRDLLRHSDVRISQRYLHSSEDRLRTMANRMGELVRLRTSADEAPEVVSLEGRRKA